MSLGTITFKFLFLELEGDIPASAHLPHNTNKSITSYTTTPKKGVTYQQGVCCTVLYLGAPVSSARLHQCVSCCLKMKCLQMGSSFGRTCACKVGCPPYKHQRRRNPSPEIEEMFVYFLGRWKGGRRKWIAFMGWIFDKRIIQIFKNWYQMDL